MTDQQSLLQAILENPNDTARRLVYADWLEENDHNRLAVFIREQCEAFFASEHLPSRESRLAPWCRARGRFHDPREFREGEPDWEVWSRIWEKQDEWCQVLSRFGEEFLFRRGFVEYGSFPAENLVDNAEKIFSLAPFLYMTIADVYSSPMSAVELPEMSQLLGLDLSNSQVRAKDARRLARCEHLRSLECLALPNALFTADNLEVLSEFPRFEQLRQLYFSYCFYDSPDGQTFHAAIERLVTLPMPNLRLLTIQAWMVEPESFEFLVNSPFVANLKALRLDGNDLTEGTLRMLTQSPYLNDDIELQPGTVLRSVGETVTAKEFHARFPHAKLDMLDEWEAEDHDDEWE